MNARKYLESFQSIEAKIQIKIRRVQQLQESLTKLSSPMDNEPVSHTRNVAVMAETVAEIVDMEKEIDTQTAMLLSRKRYAYKLLDSISPANASILIEHYIEGASISEISKSRFLSARQICRKISDAVDEFQPILDKCGANDLSWNAS